MKRIIAMIKQRKFLRILYENLQKFLDNEHKFIHFLFINNFTYNTHNDIFIFYKYGIIDNTTLYYIDEDDIKKRISIEFNEEFQKFTSKMNFDINKYYHITVDVVKTTLIEYSNTINKLSNGYEFNKEFIDNLLKTNLLENTEISNKLDKNEIYVYKIEYTLKNIDNIIAERKQLKKYEKIFIITIILIIILWITLIIY